MKKKIDMTLEIKAVDIAERIFWTSLFKQIHPIWEEQRKKLRQLEAKK
jgi:hypothetical protein